MTLSPMVAVVFTGLIRKSLWMSARKNIKTRKMARKVYLRKEKSRRRLKLSSSLVIDLPSKGLKLFDVLFSILILIPCFLNIYARITSLLIFPLSPLPKYTPDKPLNAFLPPHSYFALEDAAAL